MAHGVLISDEDFLNDLIKINMSAFSGCKMAVVQDLEKLTTLFEIDPTYDIVISMTTLKNKDIAKSVIATCTKLIPNASLIFMGDHSETGLSRNIHTIRNHYDVMSLVKIVSEIFKITQVNIPKGADEEYFAMPLSLVEKMPTAAQDFWQKDSYQNGEYMRLALMGEPIAQKIPLWKQNKILTVYIKNEHKAAAVMAMNKELLKSLTQAMEKSPEPQFEEVAQVNDNLAAQAGEMFGRLFADPVGFSGLSSEVKVALTQTANATEKMVRGITKGMPSNLNKLVDLFQKGKLSYIQKHSLLATFLSLEMSRKETWFSTQIYSKISLMIFFHDVVLIPVYNKYPNAPEDEFALINMEGLNDTERHLIRWHAKVVAQLVSQLPDLPIGLDQMILQHHGNISGILDDKPPQEEIAPLAKIVYVAELVAKELLNSQIPMSEEQKKSMLVNLATKLGRRSYIKLLQPLFAINL